MPSQTFTTSAGSTTVTAAEPVPGLHVCEIPAHISPASPNRWILATHEGAALASFPTEANATEAAHAVAGMADWTRNEITAVNEIVLGGKTQLLTDALTAAGGNHPNA